MRWRKVWVPMQEPGQLVQDLASLSSVPLGKPHGQRPRSEAEMGWMGDSRGNISAFRGVCVRAFGRGLRCLPASVPCAVPALSCYAFCLLLLLAAHPCSVSPGCFLERRKSEHAGGFFWSSRSLAQGREKCSTCSAINTSVLWRAW